MRPVPTKWETSRKISFKSFEQIHNVQTQSFKMIYIICQGCWLIWVQNPLFPWEIPLFSIDFWNVQWVPWWLSLILWEQVLYTTWGDVKKTFEIWCTIFFLSQDTFLYFKHHAQIYHYPFHQTSKTICYLQFEGPIYNMVGCKKKKKKKKKTFEIWCTIFPCHKTLFCILNKTHKSGNVLFFRHQKQPVSLQFKGPIYNMGWYRKRHLRYHALSFLVTRHFLVF